MMTASQLPISVGPGCTGIRILNLATLMDLFRDTPAFDAFGAAIVQKVAGDGVVVLTVDDTALATMTSAVPAREAFQLRIAARLAEDPELLNKLKDRAEDGRIVELGSFEVPERPEH
jgi:nucleotide-binding universal stress UspA family protein